MATPRRVYAASMCFSPEVDLAAGVAIAAIGVDALRHTERKAEWPLAALPVIFGVHQIVEAFVWWGLDGRVDADVGRWSSWFYLAVAFGLLPWFVPWAVRRLEPVTVRRQLTAVLAGIGGAVSLYLMAAVVRGPIVVTDGGYYLSYSVGLTYGMIAAAIYVTTTCGGLLLSSDRHVVEYGAINLLAVIVLSVILFAGTISLWCVWAAVTSGAIALHMRRTDPHRHRVSLVGL